LKLTGEAPFAMLMYGWDNRGDVETVMPAFEAIASSRSCSNKATAISAADGLIAAGFSVTFSALLEKRQASSPEWRV